MRSKSLLTRLLLVVVAIIATYAGITNFGIRFSSPELSADVDLQTLNNYRPIPIPIYCVCVTSATV